MKRYLALSGGGDKGLLLMGMMYQLSRHNIENVKYDEMSGISTGGLVAAITSSIDRNNFSSEMLKKKEPQIHTLSRGRVHSSPPCIRGGSLISQTNAAF